MFRHGLIREWNWIARKRRRVTFVIDRNLYHRRTQHVGLVIDRFVGSGHLSLRIVTQRIDGAIDRGRIDQGLVALDIHNYLRLQIMGDFGDTIGPRRMIGARHHDVKAGRARCISDARVVGRDNRAGNRSSRGRALSNPNNQRFSVYQQQRLAGQTSRIVTSGNDCDYCIFWEF